MKFFSKPMVMILSANLVFSVFAGGKMTKEEVPKKEEAAKAVPVASRAKPKEEAGMRFKDFAKDLAMFAAAGATMYAIYNSNNKDEERSVQLPPAQVKRLAEPVREEAARPVGAKAAAEPVGQRFEPVEPEELRADSPVLIHEGAISQGAVINPSPEDAVIQLSPKIIHSLKQQFDNKLRTPARWGARKFITFDYAHIFNTKGKRAGHYDPNNEFTERQKKASTVFPSYWQPNKIMAKIKEAYLNVGSWKYVKKSAIECKTSEGITMRIVFELKNGKSTGKVKTAYPIPNELK